MALGDPYKGTTAGLSGTWVDLSTGVTVPGGQGPPTQGFPGEPPAGKMYYGASFQTDDTTIDAFETNKVQHPIGVEREYFHSPDVAGGGIRNFITRCQNNNRLAWLSTKVPNDDWPGVANGSQDAWLRSLANVIAGFNPFPVWLCLHHEPRGEASPNTPTAYRNMYDHAYPILKNAPNVAVHPILNGYSFSPGGDPDPTIWNVQGCDFIGYDSYNQWWTYETVPLTILNSSGGLNGTEGPHPWLTPEKEFGYASRVITSWGKKTAVAEWGCHYPFNEPNKAANFMDAAYTFCLNTVPHMAMSWFNQDANSPRGGWYLDKYQKVQLPNPPDYGTYYANNERVVAFKNALTRAGTYYLP